MERLTRAIEGFASEVIVYTQGKYSDTTIGEMEYKDVRNVMKHLCDYENTGLTPEQITDLKERDTTKPARTISDAGILAICPNCGRTTFGNYRFCPDCGQRLKREK